MIVRDEAFYSMVMLKGGLTVMFFFVLLDQGASNRLFRINFFSFHASLYSRIFAIRGCLKIILDRSKLVELIYLG